MVSPGGRIPAGSSAALAHLDVVSLLKDAVLAEQPVLHDVVRVDGVEHGVGILAKRRGEDNHLVDGAHRAHKLVQPRPADHVDVVDALLDLHGYCEAGDACISAHRLERAMDERLVQVEHERLLGRVRQGRKQIRRPPPALRLPPCGRGLPISLFTAKTRHGQRRATEAPETQRGGRTTWPAFFLLKHEHSFEVVLGGGAARSPHNSQRQPQTAANGWHSWDAPALW